MLEAAANGKPLALTAASALRPHRPSTPAAAAGLRVAARAFPPDSVLSAAGGTLLDIEGKALSEVDVIGGSEPPLVKHSNDDNFPKRGCDGTRLGSDISLPPTPGDHVSSLQKKTWLRHLAAGDIK